MNGLRRRSGPRWYTRVAPRLEAPGRTGGTNAAARRAGRLPSRLPGRLPGRGLPAGDAGVSLVELLVSMGLMSVLMVMFTTAVIQIYRTVDTTEAINDSQTQVTQAIAKLDKEIRYAAEIGTPGTVGGIVYAEYFSTNSGTSRCSQLRLDPAHDQLKLRSWELGSTPPSWTSTSVLVSHADTLTFPAVGQVSRFQQLRLRLAVSADGVTGTTKQTDVTFTALNSSSNNTNTSVPSCAAER